MFKSIVNDKLIYPAIFKLIILYICIGSCGACESCDKGKGNKKDDPSRETPITDEMIAAAKNYKEYDRTSFLEEVLQKLKNNEQVDINATDPNGVNNNPPSGETALHRAIQVGNIDIVRALLARKADVTKANNGGSTPLHDEAVKGDTGIFRLLLEQPNVDINKQGNWGQTPLHLAAEWGHTEIVKLLLSRPGIQVELEDDGHQTPLYLANGKPAIEKLLKDKGATK